MSWHTRDWGGGGGLLKLVKWSLSTLGTLKICCTAAWGVSVIARLIIIKKIPRAPISHTRREHRALYNNTHARMHTHTHGLGLFVKTWYMMC